MDVQAYRIGPLRLTAGQLWFAVAMLLVLVLGCALRLKGIHNPILDHPNWRQGDTASIARNFAQLQLNPLYPQTNYDGPPPNYVELELQIVPFLAALLYKVFGVHEIFGRLITLCFSLGVVVVLGYCGRWLFKSWPAGIAAALTYAIAPGAVYYGRTFTPDTTMVFFLTAALYACARLLVEDESLRWRPVARCTALLALAFLAKPVSLVALVPLVAMLAVRARSGRTLFWPQIAVLVVVPLVVLAAYDRQVSSHAEWHWASGITTLHVLPALKHAFASPAGLGAKLGQFRAVLGMLVATMLGRTPTILAVIGFVALPWLFARSKALLWGWLAGGLAYAFVVVTVERVDYYLLLVLPVAALGIGGLARYCTDVAASPTTRPFSKWAIGIITAALVAVTVRESRAATAPYYAYGKAAYRNAVALSKTLPPDALVVIGHYGPDILYYMKRYGWEEDPLLWTPFDEESAIRKGARTFISIEDNRTRRNLELCAYLQRFPVVNPNALWPVYETDPAKEVPGAQAFWRAFRTAERAGRGRQFLDAHHVCTPR